MSWFHEHKWKVESTSFTEPLNINGKFTIRGPVVEYSDILQGVTHVYMRCKECGDLQEKKVNGKYVPVKK